ncbi:hypothetical protein PUN28_001864 [Cardiocondyla obscurior]
MMIVLILEVTCGDNSMYTKLDAIMLLTCNLVSVLKLLFYHLYADNLIHNFSSAVDDYLAIDTEKKRAIMRRHAFLGKIICYNVVFPAYVASTIFMIMPLITSNESAQVNISIKNPAENLAFPMMWTLRDFHISQNSYIWISIVQYILLMLNSSCNCGNDSLFLAIMLHVCGQIELLKIDFSKFGVTSKNLNKDFSMLISRHCYLMNNAELLIEVISVVLLVQILISCLLICFIGFQLILGIKFHDMVMITKTSTVLITLLLQLFFYSFVGDYLKCQTEEIAFSIYSCNWQNFSMKLKRNILFVIMRSQTPIQLLAGRYIIINIETYMSILKSSLSYLSVLRVMVDG